MGPNKNKEQVMPSSKDIPKRSRAGQQYPDYMVITRDGEDASDLDGRTFRSNSNLPETSPEEAPRLPENEDCQGEGYHQRHQGRVQTVCSGIYMAYRANVLLASTT
ncbi:hypothetical protein CSOJ01_09907 [Colletotrichum sojae]|uniref:Uncharacterized protein n=1 Tax=Colletotrichum sojae TaxID=2175907 RepID=A0A8H6MQQ7_9PEZI|nr:hypothetical protein CSOJ01_09907 [Colletotrichum sojae]